jgi:hypothetical protein
MSSKDHGRQNASPLRDIQQPPSTASGRPLAQGLRAMGEWSSAIVMPRDPRILLSGAEEEHLVGPSFPAKADQGTMTFAAVLQAPVSARPSTPPTPAAQQRRQPAQPRSSPPETRPNRKLIDQEALAYETRDKGKAGAQNSDSGVPSASSKTPSIGPGVLLSGSMPRGSQASSSSQSVGDEDRTKTRSDGTGQTLRTSDAVPVPAGQAEVTMAAAYKRMRDLTLGSPSRIALRHDEGTRSQVLYFLRQGLNPHTISDRTGVSVATVHYWRRQSKNKGGDRI